MRRARQHVSETLHEAGRSEWVDDATLAVSEIVANVVLHARTGCQLSVRVADESVRVSVRDFSHDLPAQRHFSSFATTGRGLSLVVRLSADFGVEALGAGGKIVWFVVDGSSSDSEVALPGEEWDLAGLLDSGDDGPDAGTSAVVLAHVPTTLWLAGLEHHAAVLRELYLVAASSPQLAGRTHDLATADAVLRLLSASSDHALEDASGASPSAQSDPTPVDAHPTSQGAPALDLVIVAGSVGTAAFGVFQDVLDRGQRLASEGRLLVRPALEELVALRDWACDQLVAQSSGVAATPWDDSFAHLAALASVPHASPDWDDTVVRTSSRAVVAADDTNRLIAVSPAAAALIGGRADDLVGRRITTIIPLRLRSQHVAGFTRHLATGQQRMIGVELDLPVLCLDGREVVRRLLIERVAVSAGRQVYVAWLDPLPAG